MFTLIEKSSLEDNEFYIGFSSITAIAMWSSEKDSFLYIDNLELKSINYHEEEKEDVTFLPLIKIGKDIQQAIKMNTTGQLSVIT